MKIKIIGDRCQNCASYTQYFTQDLDGKAYSAINHGFCGQRQCVTHPGDRCLHYEPDYRIMAKEELDGWHISKYLELADWMMRLVSYGGGDWKPEYEREKNLIRRHLEALRAQVERERQRKGA